MKIVRLIIIGLLFSLTALPSMSLAQGGRNRFMSEFGRTGEIIDRARAVVAEAKAGVIEEPSRGPILKASALVDLSLTLQEEAARLGNNGQYVEAISTSLKARTHAWEAIGIISRVGQKLNNSADENDNLVLRQLERTDDLITKMEDRLPPGPPAMIESLYDAARDNQLRAWEFYRNNQLRPALKLSRQAERTLLRIDDKLGDSKASGPRLENQLNQVEQRLNQLNAVVENCRSREAADLYTKALDTEKEARQYYNGGETDNAERTLNLVREMIQQITTLCSDTQSLERAINQLKAEIDKVSGEIRRSGNSEAQTLLDEALSHLRQAETLFNRGNRGDSAANIKAAEMNLRKAERLAGI